MTARENRAPRPKREPAWVCTPCGLKHGRRKDYRGFTATFHSGHCDVCGEYASVTEPRDFGYLDVPVVPPRRARGQRGKRR